MQEKTMRRMAQNLVKYHLVQWIALLTACCLFASHQGFGQTGPTLVGSAPGVEAVFGTTIAPGQILTLHVADLKTLVPGLPVQATLIPLPTSLAGISVRVRQYLPNGSSTEYSAPLLRVFLLNACPPAAIGCVSNISYLTVQIPFDLAFPGPKGPDIPTAILISENGTDSLPFGVSLVGDSIHIITSLESVE